MSGVDTAYGQPLRSITPRPVHLSVHLGRVAYSWWAHRFRCRAATNSARRNAVPWLGPTRWRRQCVRHPDSSKEFRETQPIWRCAEPGGRGRLRVVGVRQQQQQQRAVIVSWISALRRFIRCVGSSAPTVPSLRWQEDPESQRLDRAGERDGPLRQGLPTACPGYNLNYTGNGSGAGLNDFFGKQTDFGGSDSPLDAAKGEYDKAQAALRLAGVEPAGGVRPDRDNLQRQRRRRSWSSTGRRRQRSSTARSRRGMTPRSKRSTRAPRCLRRRSTWSSVATTPGPPTTSRSTSTWPPATARGARAPARRSTAVSVRVPRATMARRRRSRAPTDRSPTTSGRSPRRRT